MELQKGQFLALADGKGKNGFEKTRHRRIFFKIASMPVFLQGRIFLVLDTPFNLKTGQNYYTGEAFIRRSFRG